MITPFHNRRWDTDLTTLRSVLDAGRVGAPLRFWSRFDLVERHPLGSQAFVPMTEHPFLVIVAPDEGGVPGRPLAFLTAPGQGINLRRGAWHGVLTPLAEPGLFAVIDRCGEGPNLEEYRYDRGWTVAG